MYALAQIYASLPNDVTLTIVGTVVSSSQLVDMLLELEIFDPRLNQFVPITGVALPSPASLTLLNVPLGVPQIVQTTLTQNNLGTLTGQNTGTFRARGKMVLQSVVGVSPPIFTQEANFTISPTITPAISPVQINLAVAPSVSTVGATVEISGSVKRDIVLAGVAVAVFLDSNLWFSTLTDGAGFFVARLPVTSAGTFSVTARALDAISLPVTIAVSPFAPSFKISAPSPVTAGTTVPITITAQNIPASLKAFPYALIVNNVFLGTSGSQTIIPDTQAIINYVFPFSGTYTVIVATVGTELSPQQLTDIQNGGFTLYNPAQFGFGSAATVWGSPPIMVTANPPPKINTLITARIVNTVNSIQQTVPILIATLLDQSGVPVNNKPIEFILTLNTNLPNAATIASLEVGLAYPTGPGATRSAQSFVSVSVSRRFNDGNYQKLAGEAVLGDGDFNGIIGGAGGNGYVIVFRGDATYNPSVIGIGPMPVFA